VRENAAIRETGQRLESEAEQRVEVELDETLPDRLTASQISAAMALVKPQVMACRGQSTGVVMVSVKFVASGQVSAVTITSSPSVLLGDCVRAAVGAAVFVKTRSGGSFRYPFQF
jgi:outer membrane biosynthesis protein TonB